jgi:hypothetical protein
MEAHKLLPEVLMTGVAAEQFRKDDGPLRGRLADPVDRRGYQHYNQKQTPNTPRSTAATVVACVDGFNLYHGLHDKYRRRYLWLDLERLVQRMRPNDRIV